MTFRQIFTIYDGGKGKERQYISKCWGERKFLVARHLSCHGLTGRYTYEGAKGELGRRELGRRSETKFLKIVPYPVTASPISEQTLQ